jgi:hypothetical protein
MQRKELGKCLTAGAGDKVVRQVQFHNPVVQQALVRDQNGISDPKPLAGKLEKHSVLWPRETAARKQRAAVPPRIANFCGTGSRKLILEQVHRPHTLVDKQALA